jgi:hypothetical protein
MNAIWHYDEERWRLLAPTGFPAEAALHDLIEQAPQMMPLAGTPNLIVVGREVLLGGNYADLIAVEPSGRLAVIEIKLAKNAEARRAVIAQVLTYAAYLRGLDLAVLERDVLGSHLTKRGYATLADAAASTNQTATFDAAAFEERIGTRLFEGGFRLVIVLDDAPDELVRLVGYLEAVADKLVIDLVTVAAYDVAGTRVVVPQRVEPERQSPRRASGPVDHETSSPAGQFTEGVEPFDAAIAAASIEDQPVLRRLTEWAKALERDGLAKLGTNRGTSGSWTLLPRLPTEGVGMVTIWNDGEFYLSFWRSVIERRAPASLPVIESLAAAAKVGQGTTTKNPSGELLDALTGAYREAAVGKVTVSNSETPDEG